MNLMSLLRVMSDEHYFIYLDSMKVAEQDKRSSGGRENMLKVHTHVSMVTEWQHTCFHGY